MNDQQLLTLIRSLTLEEKASLCSGASFWSTCAIPEKGIPALYMADGPHGVRREYRKNEKRQSGHSHRATCFPPEAALACSFSPALARQVGAAIARECRHLDVGLLLGPGVNIKRGPLGGRNFEYYSEDPLLSGKLAAGFIEGVQGEGVGTCLKHYAVNNQETFRMSISAAVDDRALFDIYLKPFEVAVKKAQPATVMAAYNRVNGVYAAESRRLLTDVLRLRFGFSGAVISDWGAVNNRVAGVMAGMDLEMPASGGVNDYAIVQAVEAGALPEDALDAACWNILRLVFRYAQPKGAHKPDCDYESHHRLAVEALVQSAVLLKNDGLLPLPENRGVALIGEMAKKPHYQGGGSSIINPKQLVSLAHAMKDAGLPFVYEPGYRGTETTPALLEKAAAAAKEAEHVVLCLGLPDLHDCESYDRGHLSLPESQLLLLDAVSAANPNVCVVLCCGGPVEAPWLHKVRALLCLYLGGEGIGEAATQLLYGRRNPSGKLAESWPLSLADTPCAHHFPMGPNEVTYNESIYVGYRYYDTAQKQVLFPFGHGLSYTRFAYSRLRLDNDEVPPGGELAARFLLKNTGDVAGDEIVQAYVAREDSVVFQPARELKVFRRVSLAPGEEQEVELRIPYEALAFYDTASGADVVEAGRCTLLVGPGSRELPLSQPFRVQGAHLHTPRAVEAAGGPYAAPAGNTFPADAFAALYGRKQMGNRAPLRGEYTFTTPLRLMDDSATARFLLRVLTFGTRRALRFSTDRAAADRAACAVADALPFKNLVTGSFGILSPRAAQALLNVCNKKGSVWQFIKALAAKKPYRKRMPRK